MSEFERSQRINASPDAVFAFVSDIRNLPKYLPTTKAAEPQGKERVVVHGGGKGFEYDADGYFRADEQARRLEWGADESDYKGHLTVTPDGADAATVTVHLSMSPQLPQRLSEESDGAPPPGPPPIEDGLERALHSIANFVEGHGGKDEAPIARA